MDPNINHIIYSLHYTLSTVVDLYMEFLSISFVLLFDFIAQLFSLKSVFTSGFPCILNESQK